MYYVMEKNTNIKKKKNIIYEDLFSSIQLSSIESNLEPQIKNPNPIFNFRINHAKTSSEIFFLSISPSLLSKD